MELMIAANAINVTYAEALLNATPPEQLADSHPFNGELTWSGRGRQKKWVVAWLAEGRKLEDLMV